jgi:hypothetical protein
MTYHPRNRNERTHDQPKATPRWFNERSKPSRSVGFQITQRSNDNGT